MKWQSVLTWASNARRLAALQTALETQSAVATASITLVQETTKQKGFLVFVPVFVDDDNTNVSDGTKPRLLGFSLGVFPD